jgi:hypothetical protein
MSPKTQTYTIVAGTMQEAMEAVHDHDVPRVGESQDGFMLIEKTATSTNHPDVWTVECTYKRIDE